jgi:AAA ATPase domain
VDSGFVWQGFSCGYLTTIKDEKTHILHATGLTDLVGREEELDLLLRRWTKAKNSEGQVVLLSGEPGIGQSRLMAGLRKGSTRSI